MSNTVLTPQLIAREALMVLENNLVMAGLVHRNYAETFAKVGDTVTIRKPATFEAKTFTDTIVVQDAVEASTDVKLDTHLDVSFALGPTELTLNIQDFSVQFIQPAMRALAQKIDSMLCGLYARVPYVEGVTGSTPDTLADIAACRKNLNVRGVPLGDRALVIDPEAEVQFLVLDAIVNAEKSGSTEALRNASLGRVMGFELFMDQNVGTHAAGTLAVTSGTIAVDGAVAAGDTAITLDGTGLAGTLRAGDLFTVAGADGSYAVTATVTAADGAVTAAFAPAAPVGGFADDAVVTLLGTHTPNLAFHRNAFALVTRPLAPPLGAAKTETLSWNGIAVRVVYDYNSASKQDTVSLDVLCGARCLYPELACRLLG